MPIDPLARLQFEIFIKDGTPQIESDVETAVTNHVETQEPFNEAIRTIIKDTISVGSISAVANAIANLQSSTITDVVLDQVSPPLTITSYQLFGGEFGKVNSITFTPVV